MSGTSWSEEELHLTRRFVSRDLDTHSFIRDLLRARHKSVVADEFTSHDFERLLEDIWFAIDTHNGYDDLREPDEFNDAQLLDVLTHYLADWDAGTWQRDPRWVW